MEKQVMKMNHNLTLRRIHLPNSHLNKSLVIPMVREKEAKEEMRTWKEQK